MVKLALCGEMRVGKDTVANYLKEAYGFHTYAFGDRLKDSFHEKYPHIPRDPKPVRGYQLYGQLQRYVVDEDIWIDKCFQEIRFGEYVSNGYNFADSLRTFKPVITDMRQPNEFKRCTESGYVTIRIEAPLEKRLDRIKAAGDEFDPNNLKFETETHIKGFHVDHIIKNYRDLQYLYDQVDFIMEKHGVKKKHTR